MKRFVGSIDIPDYGLAMDIITALESNEKTKYDIEMYERSGGKYDPVSNTGRAPEGGMCVTIKVFIVEELQDEQLEIGFK